MSAATMGFLQRSQSHNRTTDRARHVDLVTRPRARARKHAPRFHRADCCHVDHQNPRRPRDVAAYQRDAMRRRQCEQAVDDRIHRGHGEITGQYKREQRRPRPRAHRRQVAQIHRERTVTDRLGGHERRIEVHAVNHGIGSEHVKRAALGLDHCRIVARADNDPGRHGEARSNAGNERMLADLRNGAITHSAIYSQWHRTRAVGA